MEIKKNEKLDLEGQRTTRFLLGLVIALALFYGALEYGVEYSPDKPLDSESVADVLNDTDIQPVSIMEEMVVLVPEKTEGTPEKIEIVETGEVNTPMEEPEATVAEGFETDADTETTISEAPPAVDLEGGKYKITIAEEVPQFPGGQLEFVKWLTKHLRYPLGAQRQKIEGKVLTQFVVEADGSISNITIAQSLHPLCDNEARRVLRLMPKWKPRIQNDSACRAMVCVPIVFKM